MPAVHRPLLTTIMIAVTLGAVGASSALLLVTFTAGGDARQQDIRRRRAMGRLGVAGQAGEHAVAVVLEDSHALVRRGRFVDEPAAGNLRGEILGQAVRSFGGVGLLIMAMIAGIAAAVQHALGFRELAVDEQEFF